MGAAAKFPAIAKAVPLGKVARRFLRKRGAAGGACSPLGELSRSD